MSSSVNSEQTFDELRQLISKMTHIVCKTKNQLLFIHYLDIKLSMNHCLLSLIHDEFTL